MKLNSMTLNWTVFAVGAWLATSTFGPGSTASGADLDAYLKRLQDSSADVRKAAWEAADAQGSEAIPGLIALASGENRDSALAASLALNRLAHSSSAPGIATRPQVASALAKGLADPAAGEKVKLQLLELLGSVGGPEAVPGVAAALLDTKLQDFARKALERIPHEAASRALEAAAKVASGEWRDALVVTLGKKHDRTAVPFLLEAVKIEGGPRLAAAKALARIGDPAAIDAIRSAIESTSGREKALLADDYLQMADDLRKSGDSASARKIYEEVLAHGDEARRYTALFALYSSGAATDNAILLKSLDDASPRLRALALELLVGLKGDAVNGALFERMAAAKGAQRAAYLRALEARKAPGVDKSLAEALTDADLDVRVTALELAGKLSDGSNEPVLIDALEKGAGAVKATAAKACLDIADAKAAKDPAAGAALYARVLDASSEAGDKRRALLGLGKAAHAPSLPRILEARKDPALASSAHLAYVSYALGIGRSGKKEEALKMLEDVLSAGLGREAMQLAISGVKELGGDPTFLQKRLGFIAAWKIVGPFPNVDGKGFATVFSPEQELRFDGKQKDERGRDRKWAELISTSLEGKVDLRTAFQKSSDVCAYAYAEVESSEARDVLVKTGSDDGLIVWLNGKRITEVDTIRAWAPDQDSKPARLEKGKNAVLLKITQGGGEWEFSFRVTDSLGQALDLTAIAKP